MAVKRRVEDPIGLEWSRRHIVEISPTVGFVDTVIGSSNQIVHQLLEGGVTKYPVLVTLFRRSNAIFASFRSRHGEALQIATKFQGGGHANAAGAILPKSARMGSSRKMSQKKHWTCYRLTPSVSTMWIAAC